MFLSSLALSLTNSNLEQQFYSKSLFCVSLQMEDELLLCFQRIYQMQMQFVFKMLEHQKESLAYAMPGIISETQWVP